MRSVKIPIRLIWILAGGTWPKVSFLTWRLMDQCSWFFLFLFIYLFFFYFFFWFGFYGLSRIFHLYRTDRSLKAGENPGKTQCSWQWCYNSRKRSFWGLFVGRSISWSVGLFVGRSVNWSVGRSILLRVSLWRELLLKFKFNEILWNFTEMISTMSNWVHSRLCALDTKSVYPCFWCILQQFLLQFHKQFHNHAVS